MLRRHRAFALLAVPFSLAVGCSSFSEADNLGPDDGGVADSAAPLDTAAPTDGGATDAPSDGGAPVGYTTVFHFDDPKECGKWQPLHGATFTTVSPGLNEVGSACQICQAFDPLNPDGPPFVSISLPPQSGRYDISAWVRQKEIPVNKALLRLGMRASKANGESRKNATAISTAGLTYTTTRTGLTLTGSELADGEISVVSPTIEIDPEDPDAGSDECWDVDEVIITFTP